MSRRYFEALRPHDSSLIDSVPDHLFLVQVARAQYRWHQQKPYYALVFSVLEPTFLSSSRISGRLYCTSKALWKLNSFLHEFRYDAELLSRGEINDHALVGLRGVVKVSFALVRGLMFLNFDAFAPAEKWRELSSFDSTENRDSEVVE